MLPTMQNTANGLDCYLCVALLIVVAFSFGRPQDKLASTLRRNWEYFIVVE